MKGIAAVRASAAMGTSGRDGYIGAMGTSGSRRTSRDVPQQLTIGYTDKHCLRLRIGDFRFTHGITHLGDDKSPGPVIYSLISKMVCAVKITASVKSTFYGKGHPNRRKICLKKNEAEEIEYQIRVQGRIEAQWSTWLNGMTIIQESEEPPVTRISGVVIDQAKLRGIINQLWDLNLTLISVNRENVGKEEGVESMDAVITQETILSLADPRATLETAGGKGASLARLMAAGLPVPGGFHITTAAYRQFVEQNELQPRILEILTSADLNQPSTLERASRQIQELFEHAQVPVEIGDAIEHAYAGLPGVETPVAVRSSATAEDLPELSFAGQQETFLNVQGIQAVQEAVKRCWASLWTARAIGYRMQHNIDQDAVSLAVVVQEMVAAEAAGILFTANPLNGQRDQMLINAAWGLGEAMVGRQVTPDTITVDKDSGQVIERQIADKQVMTVVSPEPR